MVFSPHQQIDEGAHIDSLRLAVKKQATRYSVQHFLNCTCIRIFRRLFNEERIDVLLLSALRHVLMPPNWQVSPDTLYWNSECRCVWTSSSDGTSGMYALTREVRRLSVRDSLFVGGAYTVKVLPCNIADGVSIANGRCVPPWTFGLDFRKSTGMIDKSAETTGWATKPLKEVADVIC